MLEIEGLVHRYANGRGVGPVSLRVRAGEALGVVGPNGAGKSTLFNGLCGSGPLSGGAVRLNGRDTGRRLPSAAVGFLPETCRLLPSMTALQAVAFERGVRGLAVSDSGLADALGAMGVDDAGDAAVSALSQGMRRRVGIVCAFLGSPPVVVADEPLNGLDVDGVLLFRDLLRDYLAHGGALLISSHILDLLDEVCARVLLLRDGLVVETVDADGGRVEQAYRRLRAESSKAAEPRADAQAHRRPRAD